MKKKSEEGIISEHFEENVDLECASTFIKENTALAIHFCSKKYKVYDRHIVLSSALEALHQAYISKQTEFGGQFPSERTKIGIIKSKCHRCLYHQLLFYEIFRDKRQVYYPRKWVSWDEYFNGISITEFSKYDLQELMKTEVFSETEKLFINLLIEGNEPVEIAKLTGYVARHVHKSLEKIQGRLEKVGETSYSVPKKWRRVGPYKSRRDRFDVK